MPRLIRLFFVVLLLAACAPGGAERATANPAPATPAGTSPTPFPSETATPRPTQTPFAGIVVPEDLRGLPAFSAFNIEGIFEVASLEIGVDIADIHFAPEGEGYSLWVATWEQDSRLEHWDIYSAQKVHEMAVGEIFAPRSLSGSPDGGWLVTADEDDVQLFDVFTGPQVFDFEPSPRLEEAAISPVDGLLLAVGYASVDGTVVFIDLGTGEDLAVFRHGDLVTDIDFSSDGRYLASGSANGTVKLIDVESFEETLPFEEVGWVDSVAVEAAPADAGGHLLAISTGGEISLWDAATGELHSVLGGHGSEVQSMDFSPNGELLASGGRDGELKIWDVVTGAEMASYELEGEIRRVLFSADGTLLAATTLLGPVWVWAVDGD